MQLSWLQLALVAFGGALGSVARFLGSGVAYRLFPGVAFPIGTLVVNVAGCLFIGFVGGLAEGRQFLVPDLRIFLFTGVLGGFTTFSAFAFESLGLGLDGAWLRFGTNIVAQLVLGLGAAWAGYAIGRAV